MWGYNEELVYGEPDAVYKRERENLRKVYMSVRPIYPE